MKRFLFILTTLVLLTSACGSTSSAHIAKSRLRREQYPKISDDNLEALVSGNNTFAVDLYRSLRTEPGNLVISPYSISTAFAMTYAGARGATASQIASTLHFDLPDDQLHTAFNALDLALAKRAGVKVPEDRDPMQLNVVNATWAQENLSFQTPFLDTLGRNYNAGIHLVDFGKDAGAAQKAINDWAARETHGKIKNMVPEGAFDQSTGLVLLNAVYFEADWRKEFLSAGAKPFHLLDGSQINVPSMRLDQEYMPYARRENWLAVELPYAGETFSMVIVVPDPGAFDQVEAGMDYQTAAWIIGSLSSKAVDLTMPKFEFSNDFALAGQLKSLGIADAFSVDADFSGMTGKRDLYLGDTFHKTYIAVDEEGTCAAAVTEQRFLLISGLMDVIIPVDIDRPFLFIIRDVESGQILFIGRVLDPRQ